MGLAENLICQYSGLPSLARYLLKQEKGKAILLKAENNFRLANEKRKI